MDSADLADILGTVRSFVRDVVVPAEDEIEETDAIPRRRTRRVPPDDHGELGFHVQGAGQEPGIRILSPGPR